MKQLRSCFLLGVLLALEGCTGVCTNSGVEGSYELSVRGVSYALQLRPGGQGTLRTAGKGIGDLRWTLANVPGQQIVELDAAGEVYTALSGIAPSKGRSTGPITVSSGVLAPAPECNRQGRMTKLVLDYDERIEFRRSRS
jgi:hypothetical protein